MDRRRYLAAAGTAVAAGLGGCLGLTRGDNTEFDVGMRPTSFDPPTITVAVGEELVWENTGTRDHTVTAYEESLPDGAAYFASGGYESEATAREAWSNGAGGALSNGEQFSYTFEIPGEYEYFCIPHESGGMVGTVIVEDRTPTATPEE
ncbi:halocyanin [Halolamina sp. CBA1230]|uniref:cupredoxin domain-containing protein n=1 Tax=Halolamina sp. CBA1230 TaxID=1853690 RepID=UPI0009A23BA1|nr:plastocyanin/azurin family copper-binding protein [Halolamina sp. CBA1230]QKY19241.1 halocyanin [Halolamina sp. CBA1230]